MSFDVVSLFLEIHLKEITDVYGDSFNMLNAALFESTN